MSSTTVIERCLVILFAALYFLFPTFISVSHAALVLIVVTGIATLRKETYIRTISSNRVIWGFGLLMLMVLVGLLYKPNTDNWDWALLHLKKYAIFAYAIVIILLLTDRNHLQKISMNAFIGGMSFVVLSTWLNIWFLLPWSKSQELGWGKSHHVFGDYITQGVMMAFFAIIVLHKSIHAKDNKFRILWGIGCLLTIIGITHLMQGRTGLLLLIVGVITYALLIVRGKWRLVSLGSILVLIGITIGSSNLIKNRISLAYEEIQRHDVDLKSSMGHRLFNYKTTSLLILEKPVLGHGTGAFHTEICRFIGDQDACQMYTWHPHNQFLFFGADHGLIGMLLYALLIFSLYYTALRSRNLDAKVLLCSLASILLFDSLINSPFYSSRESQFFGYMIALLVSMCASQYPAENSLAEDSQRVSL